MQMFMIMLGFTMLMLFNVLMFVWYFLLRQPQYMPKHKDPDAIVVWLPERRSKEKVPEHVAADSYKSAIERLRPPQKS
jgi:hypothetical protein